MAMCVPEIPDEFSYFKRLTKNPNLDVSEALQYEFRRLASFATWPEGTDVDFFRAAKNGLYYTGSDNKINCFSCKLIISISNSHEDPAKIHKLKSPSCPILQHTDLLNKPLCVSDDEDFSLEAGFSDIEIDLDETDSRSGSFSVSASGNLATGGQISEAAAGEEPKIAEATVPSISSGHFTPDQDLPQEGAAALPAPIDKRVHGVTYDREYSSLPSGSKSPSINLKRESTKHSSLETPSTPSKKLVGINRRGSSNSASDMFREENRLQTFHNWPEAAEVNPRDLARLGFFYRGEDDKTECAFCNGVLRKWERGDDIEAEHRKYFERCPFLNGRETRNVPMVEQPAEAQASGEDSLERRAENALTMTRRPLTSENERARPMHPDFRTYRSRLESFKQNESSAPTNVSAESLAEAGFYSAGFDDNVRCHFCDGGLRNWERGDKPWVEHARWFPRCAFLLAEKGLAFIEDVKRRFPVIKNPPQGEVADSPEEDPLQGLPLNVDFLEKARSMGFTDGQIKQAVENNQGTQGHTFLDMQSLVDALLALMPAPTPTPRPPPPSEPQGASNEPSPKRQTPPRAKEPEEEEEKTPAANQPKPKKSKKKKKKNNANNETTQPTPAPLDTAATLIVPDDDEESRSIQEENRLLKEQRMCKVCMDEEVNIVFLPCGHLVACSNCAPALRSCPICRALIRGSLRTYLS